MYSAVTFGMASTNMYYFTNMMNNVFVQNTPDSTGAIPAFVNLATMEDIWSVRQTVFSIDD